MIKVFNDTAGRPWEIRINVFAVKQVKRLLDLDMMAPETLIPRLVDPIFLCDLLFVLCSDQAKERGISDEEFGRGMGGPTLEDALTILTEEYIDFFPNPEMRENLRKLTDKVTMAMSRIQGTISKRLDAVDGEIDAAMEELTKNLQTTGN